MVLVTCFLYLLSFSAKATSTSYHSLHIIIRFKQVTIIMTETFDDEWFLLRPIDDEAEHS